MKKSLFGGAWVLSLALGVTLSDTTLAQPSQPDLAVHAIKLKPAAPEAGTLTKIRAFIRNQGAADALDVFYVIFEINGQEVAQRSVTQLGVGQTAVVDLAWQAVLGRHSIRVAIDISLSNLRDANRENNQMKIEIEVPPAAGVRSATRQIVEAFGDALEQAGQALRFEASSDARKVYDDVLNALTGTAHALREVLEDLQIIKKALPARFAQEEQLQRAEAIAAVYDSLAEITLRMMGAFSLGNFDMVLEQASGMRALLEKLASYDFEGSSFSVLRPAITQLEKIIPLAKELKEILGGASGRDLGAVSKELFEAFLAFGAGLAEAGQALKRAAEQQAVRFTDSMGNPVSVYFAGNTLVAWAAGAQSLMLEIFTADGRSLRTVQEAGDRLEFNGTDDAGNPLPATTYFYKLTAQHVARSQLELGRLIIATR